jgi:predicted nucleic acid-binding protein
VSVRFIGPHKRILIDTSVWIYHLEQNSRLAPVAGRVIESLQAGKVRGVASELTLLELTAGPLRVGRQDVADDYEILLDYFPNFELQPISREILLEAAGLRARHRLRAPDAIQIATGVRYGATLAVTNDEAWRNVQSIETVVLADLAPG